MSESFRQNMFVQCYISVSIRYTRYVKGSKLCKKMLFNLRLIVYAFLNCIYMIDNCSFSSDYFVILHIFSLKWNIYLIKCFRNGVMAQIQFQHKKKTNIYKSSYYVFKII